VKALERAGLVGLRNDGSPFDYFRDRLMFPICDIQGRVIAFGGRVLGAGEPKYLNTRDTVLFTKGRSIYGLHLARETILDGRRVVLVEGYTDVIMCHQFGFKNVVAALGTAVTADHTRVLRRLADEIDLLTDSDEAGANAAERSLGVFFQEAVSARIVRLPGTKKDPCEFLLENGAEAFSAALQEGQDLFEFKFARVAAANDLSRPDGQTRAASALMELVSLSPDPVRRAAYRREVAARLNLPEGELKFSKPVRANTQAEPAPEGTIEPEHALAHAEREVLRWLFHQPAWILTTVGEVDLTTFTGLCERLIARSMLSAVDAGRLPPDAPELTSDSHSLSGLVAHEVMAELHSETDLFAGKVVDEKDLERARRVCVELAEEGPKFERLKPEELYEMLRTAFRRKRLEYELSEAKRAVAAARARGDAAELEAAQRREQDAQMTLLRASKSWSRRPRTIAAT
jgi:DNA primase